LRQNRKNKKYNSDRALNKILKETAAIGDSLIRVTAAGKTSDALVPMTPVTAATAFSKDGKLKKKMKNILKEKEKKRTKRTV